LRADAERNRERIMQAARRLFATEGLGVSMASVAREAGVGKATLSRRFATREELINAVFTDRMDGYVAAIRTALADPDPWHGFVGFIEAGCAMQAADRGFAAVLRKRFPVCTVVTGDAERLARHLHELRGKVDFVISGLPLLLFTAARKARVLQQALTMLGRGGCIHQFTYGGRCSVGRALLARYGLRARLLGVAALNIPPAFVYRLTRIDD